MSELVLTPDALPASHHKPIQSLGFAVVLECAIVASVAFFLARTTPATHTEPVFISLEQEEVPPEKPEQPLPKLQQVTMVSKIAPPKAPTPPQTIVDPTPPMAEMQTDVPTAFSDPVPVPAAPPAPPPSHGKTDLNAEYAGKVHEAVQAAYFYPSAAAAMHFSGRVRVEFLLQDGRVKESSVLQSCGIGLFDKAALQAVQVAHYPVPPEPLRGRELPYQIWIELSTH